MAPRKARLLFQHSSSIPATTASSRDDTCPTPTGGLTQITDRSREILGRIATLEQVELYEVNGVTDAGLTFLASLPRLREAAFDSLPGVTLAGTRVFAVDVRVRYST